jgi:hypothetical protein
MEHLIRARRRPSLLFCLPVVLAAAPLIIQEPASQAPTGLGSKSWVGRYQEVEEYLRTAECARLEGVGAAVTARKRCVLPPGGPVSRMSWNPLPPGIYRGFRESYKAEIAAYELDKLLKTDMVPPTVERELQGNKGSATLWVEPVKPWAAVTPPLAYRAHWERQVLRMKMFDDLMGYGDRNNANMLYDPEWNLILIDHSRAFRSDSELPQKLTGIDKDLWARMESLTRPQLDATLGPWLADDEVSAILKRRERMTAEVRSLPKQKE